MNNFESYSHEDDLAFTTSFTTWPSPLWAIGGSCPNPSVPQSTYPDLAFEPGYPTTVGSYPDFNAAADNAAFSFAPTAEMGAFPNLPTELTNQNVLDPWLMPTQSSIDVSPAVAQPQSVGDPYWTGVTPPAAYSAATTPDSGVSPTPTTPMSQDMWAWISDLLQPYTTPASSPGDGGEAGWPAPEHGAGLFEATTSPAGPDASEFSWPVPAASGHVASNATTYVPTTFLGKRRREAEEPQGDGDLVGSNIDNVPPQKRARGRTSGVLKGKRSTARTRHNLVARIPDTTINGKPKEAGRGAERLATPNAHGIYHQSSPGPSFQQGWAVEPAYGKPNWVEGSVDEEAAHRVDGTVQQQQEATELFKIPRIFKDMYRLLLQTSQADLARGAVQEIKCRLCPDTKLKDFEEFKRHCKTTETHPLDIRFCDDCGDYFARCDSLKRHHNKPPAECRKVTPAKAAEKRRVTEEEHKVFIRRLKHGLMTGKVIGRSFSEIIKEKYPESSKKRTRQ